MSREISIVSVSEDDRNSEKDHKESKDDDLEQLMRRIQKQRSVLDDILEQEKTSGQEISASDENSSDKTSDDNKDSESAGKEINQNLSEEKERNEISDLETENQKLKKLSEENESEMIQGSLISYLQILSKKYV